MDFTRVKENLLEKGYYVSIFETGQEAVDYLAKEITGTEVGIGGSATVEELGLYEELIKSNKVHWHWKMPEGKNHMDVRWDAVNADVYISSVNALAETGEIVNIDGMGNRVAGTSFARDRVFFIVGKNKLVPDLEAALDRAENVAAPMNAQRLAPEGDQAQALRAISRVYSILKAKPTGGEFEVVLIDEDLGF